MALFLLSPINLDSPEWTTSPVLGPVQVVAEDEPQARHTAAGQLCLPDSFTGQEGRADKPWLRVDRARVRRIKVANDSFPLLEGHVRTGRPGRLARHLFVLSPVNTVAPEWELSMAMEEVCVKALNVAQARAIAALHFSVGPPVAARLPGLYPPWWKPRLVMATKVAREPHGIRVITAQDRPLRFSQDLAGLPPPPRPN
jgi:hypothetical protein